MGMFRVPLRLPSQDSAAVTGRKITLSATEYRETRIHSTRLYFGYKWYASGLINHRAISYLLQLKKNN